MIRIRYPLLFILATVVSLMAQDYIWPVKLERSISSNFGEFRPRRFHAGMDIKTEGSTGHEVVAVDDGYIWKVKVSSDGYGKAIYLRLRDEKIAVYAHLESFMPVLNDIIKLEQKRNQSYSVEKVFRKNEFAVRKGDRLGYSGESGHAFAPHLHFELRDRNNRPLNPLNKGFDINDGKLPAPKAVAITPLSREAVINGSSLPQIFPLRRVKTGEYEFPDTIHVFGTIGLEVSATDRISKMPNRFNIYGAILSVDGIEHYKIEFDQFPFEQSHLIEIERDNSFKRLNEGEFHRLFATEASKQLDFIDTRSGGKLNLTPGYHRVTIKLYDHAKNLVHVRGILLSAPPTDITASLTRRREETVEITLEPHGSPFPISDFVCYSFNRKGFVEQKVEAISIKRVDRGLVIELPTIETRNRILQFIGINKLGAVSRPFHLPVQVNEADYMTVKLDFSASHLENTIVLQVETDEFISRDPEMVLIGEDIYVPIRLRQVRPNAFLSEPIDPSELGDIEGVVVSISGSPVRETRFAFKPKVATTTNTIAAVSADDHCSLQAVTTTFYDRTAFWIEDVEQPVAVEGGTFLSKTYQLQPFDRPLRDSARVAIALSKSIRNPSRMGIFYYDQKKGWTYLPSRFSKKKWMFFSSLYSLEAIAIVEDTVKPVISQVFPDNGGHYRFEDVKTLSAHAEDDLAGIKSDTALFMVLDGKNLLFEYHPIKKTMSSTLESPLEAGEHRLIVGATDQVGNSTTKEIIFDVD